MEKVHGVLVMTLLEMLFSVDNSSSSHNDNCKNNLLLFLVKDQLMVLMIILA